MQDALSWISGHAWLVAAIVFAVIAVIWIFLPRRGFGPTYIPDWIRGGDETDDDEPSKGPRRRWYHRWQWSRPISTTRKDIDFDKIDMKRWNYTRSKNYTGGSDVAFELPRELSNIDLEAGKRSLGLLLATTRDWETDKTLGFRRSPLSFGSAVVRVPEDHRIGQVERPWQFGVFGWSIYRQQEVETSHFTLRSVAHLDREDFIHAVSRNTNREAIVFVHGFNNSVEDALFRLAQIVWDAQFTGVPIAFSWPSRTGILNYPYDRESAVYSVNGFIELLALLQTETDLASIHIIAHSMGNQIVTEALTRLGLQPPPRKLGEIILAAPDVDWDVFLARAPSFKDLSRGVTLYASAADRALVASRQVANGPRAGDVLASGPLIAPNVDTIDVTSLGEEIFGLNHNTFAANRSHIDDMALLIGQGLRPPNKRLAQIRGAPEGTVPPQYWRYA